MFHDFSSRPIQNAIDFSSVEGRIELAAEVEKGAVNIIVEDGGPGM